MSLLHKLLGRSFGVCVVLLAMLTWQGEISAAQLRVTWLDNSTNEDGFKIERGPATTGPFTQIGTVLANVTSYTDSGLADATNFCYRVRAFNAAQDSGYTNVVCGTTTATLTVAKNGSGTVTSSPAGINCGTVCSQSYNSGTSVTLTATAAAGSTFTGWSGACSGTGSCAVTMDAAKSVTATFASQTFALTTSRSGNGSGTVTSSPAGINCGTVCSQSYNSGTSVTLTATAAAGST
ncbi:MAG TPA: fibronectin type III domain-containing protein, partial [Methylomirabilota bacterium]|nr:fibronectin type III domain-containing protein [Methylomirabilota bacterium]